MLVLAHISDLHLDGSDRATRRAERVRDLLWGLPGPVDALLVTGDIADHGTEAEYEEAARLLGLREGGAPFPVLTCPGNHDSRAPYRKALLGEPSADGPVNSVHVFADAAVLMCDTSIPGQDEGELDAQTHAWIEETLDGLEEVDIRPGTQSGQSIPLHGRGVTHLRGGGRGDLIVHVEVMTPTKLDPEQERLLRELAKLRGEERPTGQFQPGQQGLFSRLKDAFNGR